MKQRDFNAAEESIPLDLQRIRIDFVSGSNEPHILQLESESLVRLSQVLNRDFIRLEFLVQRSNVIVTLLKSGNPLVWLIQVIWDAIYTTYMSDVSFDREWARSFYGILRRVN
jgi:hypothetical protein